MSALPQEPVGGPAARVPTHLQPTLDLVGRLASLHAAGKATPERVPGWFTPPTSLRRGCLANRVTRLTVRNVRCSPTQVHSEPVAILAASRVKPNTASTIAYETGSSPGARMSVAVRAR